MKPNERDHEWRMARSLWEAATIGAAVGLLYLWWTSL